MDGNYVLRLGSVPVGWSIFNIEVGLGELALLVSLLKLKIPVRA